MKITIGILFLIGVALLILAKRMDGRATNPDDWNAAFTQIGGFLFLAAAVVLTVGFGLYRLFTS
jgi:hypothetical protein